MKYQIIRKEYDSEDNLVSTVSLGGTYAASNEADDAICQDISNFRDHHDNDERVDWNAVNVYDDIGRCRKFVWSVCKK